MYLKINKKKINIIELNKFTERFKSIKFVFEPIDYIIMFPKKKSISTVFFCQKVDIIFTDHNNKILYIFHKVKTEKRITRFKAKNIYILPLGYADNFSIGDILNIKEKE